MHFKTIYLILLTTQDACSYKRLEGVALNEGNSIPPFKDIRTYEECETLCGETQGCQSFRYCPNAPSMSSCWIRDKKISYYEKIGTLPDCFTVYKSCRSGKY